MVVGVQDRSVKGGYDPEFSFCNSYGLPKATVRLLKGATFYNRNPDGGTTYNVEIGNVVGEGTLAGGGTYTIGGLNTDFSVGFTSESAIVKKGTGIMSVYTPGLLKKTVTIREGALYFDADGSTPLSGGALTAENATEVVGSGLLTSLIMRSGSMLTPRSIYLEELFFMDMMPGYVKSTAAMNFNSGSTLNIVVVSNSDYSTLQPRMLTMNGTVQVTLSADYTPKVGDTFTIWTVDNTFSGTPAFNLPALPRGMAWDTSAVAAKTGVLSIVESTAIPGDVNGDGQVGIGDIVAVTNFMAGTDATLTLTQCDVNGDGEVGIGDIVAITNLMAGTAE